MNDLKVSNFYKNRIEIICDYNFKKNNKYDHRNFYKNRIEICDFNFKKKRKKNHVRGEYTLKKNETEIVATFL